MAKVGRIEAVKELHERYGHISYDTLRSLPECPNFEGKPRWDACEKGKAAKPPTLPRMQPIRISRVLERLHCDLVGPINPITPGIVMLTSLFGESSSPGSSLINHNNNHSSLCPYRI
jgi:hypothetical protein